MHARVPTQSNEDRTPFGENNFTCNTEIYHTFWLTDARVNNSYYQVEARPDGRFDMRSSRSRESFWSWMLGDANRFIFTKTWAIFYIFVPSDLDRGPLHLKFAPPSYSCPALVSTKLEFLRLSSRENRTGRTDRRTDEQGATLDAAPKRAAINVYLTQSNP